MACEYSYRFAQSAERDLDEILRYISIDLANPVAAQGFGRKVFEKIDMIRTFPDSCELVDNEFLSDKAVRKLLVDNYVLYYKADYSERTIVIIRIVYGKRNLDEVLKTI